MCDQEVLVGYLYGELPPAERSAFDGHLRTCADCRGEVEALKGTRTVLQEWTPPESHLGFEMVRRADPVVRPARARWWGLSPAWGLAAAAMLVGAVSAAIAQVEVTVGSGGVTVRTGWAAAAPDVQRAQAGSNHELERVSARLADLEQQLAKAAAAVVPASTTSTAPAAQISGRMSDAELVRTFRHMIEASEERQQGVLARQILQINRDLQGVQRTDFERLGRVTEQLQRTAVETFQRQRALEDHVMRVGLQR